MNKQKNGKAEHFRDCIRFTVVIAGQYWINLNNDHINLKLKLSYFTLGHEMIFIHLWISACKHAFIKIVLIITNLLVQNFQSWPPQNLLRKDQLLKHWPQRIETQCCLRTRDPKRGLSYLILDKEYWPSSKNVENTKILYSGFFFLPWVYTLVIY